MLTLRIVVLSILCLGCSTMPAQIPLEKKLTHYFKKKLEKYNLPSLSVALVHKDKILYAAGIGFADKENHIPATPDTLYNIGSVTKVVTATALMTLVEQGYLHLNWPAHRYLPRLRVKAPWGKHRPFTVWDLLTHYSGLPRSLPKFDPKLLYPPHTRYNYSNLGFTLLGKIIQNVSRRPFAQFMKERLFDPLDMHTAQFSSQSARTAQGYRNNQRFNQRIIRGKPAGGLYASALDMAKFMNMVLMHGSYKGRTVLRPQTIREMFTIQNRQMPDFGRRAPLQGLGWIIARKNLQDDFKIVWHNGRTQAFRSVLLLVPEKQLGISIATNQSGKQKRFSLQRMARKALTMALNAPDMLKS